MKIQNLYSFLAAAHLSCAVDGIPEAFNQRGGIMLVAPPEQMKSSIVKCLDFYGDSLVVSDLNVKQVTRYLRDEIANGKYKTLAFTAFEKLYQRDPDTASNIEGLLSGMVEEGFGHASWEDSRTFVRIAKVLVVGALVEDVYKLRISQWLSSGFARRFLWCHFRLKDQHAITRSIIKWEPIVVENGGLPILPYANIPYSTTEDERRQMARILNDAGQPGTSTPLILCSKVLTVLKWMYRDSDKKKAMDIFCDFAQCLRLKGGAEIEFPSTKLKAVEK